MKLATASQRTSTKAGQGGRRNFLRLLALGVSGLVCPSGWARAEGPRFEGQPSGAILTAGSKRVMILSPQGTILWEYPSALTHDAWMLPSGNILFADGESVTEVTRAKKVVWQFQPKDRTGGGTYACQRLANGNTMVGENSSGRILEVSPTGEIISVVQTSPCKVGEHHNLRTVRKLGNGNYLACHSGSRLVKE